ncbi:hypothetical protein [Hymenobacter arizonensis]|uniref:DUF3592 domain-containing protein n=1 Tax=Hymenobacter arizonensis TaxID=1227077 RepID=A0A1I5SFL3_HYMAR|nr:hypothetical protein [Hymenobacter arizonensis]SFP69287.1 hypothetical protein SAMN04515668_0036 [Hymenobacter arizonensis]
MQLSFSDKASVFFINPYARPAALFALVGVMLFFAFLPKTDFRSPYFQFGSIATAYGYVLGKENTNNHYNDRPIQEITYQYSIGNEKYTSSSFSSVLDVTKGDEVLIEYLVNTPNYSRIKGSDGAPFPLETILFISCFAVIGLGWTYRNLLRAQRILAILDDTHVVVGARGQADSTNEEINDRTVYMLNYNYQVNEQDYTHSFKTQHPGDFREFETLLSNRSLPSSAVMASSLPVKIKMKLQEKLRLS